MTRHFSIHEAEKFLYYYGDRIRLAMLLNAELQRLRANQLRQGRAVLLSGGAFVDLVKAIQIRSRRQALASRLKELLEELRESGCFVRDLNHGTIDFPTLYRDREVLLCWKYGEEKVGFWHETNEGFSQRRPIDDEFLKFHRGDSPQ